ncbi:response regulator transcription factor, partial [Sulfurimonas sp.]|uniref:response regulator transcription factor n=1 Tax=Sulfurimonas sp. TaxID=2022749 RepID=UPI003D0C2D34
MRDSLFLKSKTVLFAEDDIAMRTEMVKVLTMIFKEVLVAEDGEEALRLYEEETPDILITDIKMPKRDGVSLIRRIRKEDYQFPIVLMTSYTEKKFLLDVVNLSIDAYLIKPVELNQLVSALKSAFQRLPIRESIISLGKSFYYNTATKELYHDGNLIVLGVREHDFLKLLIDNLNRTVTKSGI